MTAKQWLSRGYDIDKEINALLLAQVRLRASMMHVTPAYSGDVRVQTSIVRGDQTETAIDRLTELEKRINERIDSLTAVKAEILSAIAKVGNQRCGRFSQKDMSISRRGRISQQGSNRKYSFYRFPGLSGKSIGRNSVGHPVKAHVCGGRGHPLQG